MVRQFNIHEAKTHFSELITAVERGEEIVIARRGKPVARVSAFDRQAAPRKKRVFGQWAGKIKVDPSFYEPMSEDELKEWEAPIEGLEHLVAPTKETRAG